MRKIIIIPFLTFIAMGLCSCSSLVYKLEIQQGNIITDEMIHQLHPGMSEAQVISIMGNPVLVNAFSDREWVYVYTEQRGTDRRHEQHTRLYFRNGVLTHFTSDVGPGTHYYFGN